VEVVVNREAHPKTVVERQNLGPSLEQLNRRMNKQGTSDWAWNCSFLKPGFPFLLLVGEKKAIQHFV